MGQPGSPTKAQVGFWSFVRSLPFTIGTALIAQNQSKPDSTWQEYVRAIPLAVVASIMKGFTSTASAKDVTIKA